MISVRFQGKSFNITVIQVYTPTNNAEEAEVNGPMKTYKTFQNLYPKKMSFSLQGSAKVGSQETPGVTGKFSFGIQNESGQRLTEFCQENALVIANTLFQQHKGRLYQWTSPDGKYQNHINDVHSSQRWRSSIQSAKSRPGTDCGSDHEILFAKFGLKLKKIWETSRPFRYILNQIPYEYTVKVKNRFNGLDLIDRVPEDLWMEVHDVVQKALIKIILKKKKWKRQIGCLRRP